MLAVTLLVAALMLAVLGPALRSASVGGGRSLPTFGGSSGGIGISGDAIGALRSARELLKNMIILMAALTNYAEEQFLKHQYRTGTITKPTVMAAGLYTATPGEAGGGTEVTGGSYARVDLPPLDANWRAASGGDGTTNNLAAITFPAPTANWGTITSTGQSDATSAGNLWNYGALTTSKTVNNADAAPSFSIGAFSFQIDS